MREKQDFLFGCVCIGLATLIFSTMEVILKLPAVEGAFHPMQITLGRFLIGGLFLLPVAAWALHRKQRKLTAKDLRAFAITGLFCVPLAMVFYQLALVSGHANVVAVIFSGNPIFVTILAFLLLRESIRWNNILALVLEVLGILAIAVLGGGGGSLLSVVLAILAALFFALYAVLGKRETAQVGTIVVTCGSFLFGSVELLVLLLLGHTGPVSSFYGAVGLDMFQDVPLLQVPAMAYGTRYDSASQAHRLFEALHQLDEAGAARAYARLPRKRGVGLAVYNRLIRAAAFQVVNPKGRHIVGLTGPTGAGKSTVGQALAQRGCYVIDCDKATRSPQVYDAPCLEELAAAFGPQVLRDGALDRAELARRAFASQEARARLGEITFPRILGHIRRQLAEGEAQGFRVLVLDAPTLFESGLDAACSRILAVDAPKEERLARVLRRDGVSQEAALRRLEAQPAGEFYTARADFVVENGPGAQVEEAVEHFLNQLEENTRL